jgi:DNA polymerase-3 subunit alpha
MFERFLNPERVTPPDADLDFDERRRADLVRYVTEKYGSAHVSQILTLGTIKAKGAIKDAARVLDQPYSLGEAMNKMLPAAAQGDDAPLSALDDENHARHAEFGQLREYLTHSEEARKVIAAARGLEGFIRSTGVHAAGVILSAEPLIDVLPLTKRQNDGAIICGFEYPQAESMGLLKIDFLGLRNLTILSDALKAIKARLGIEVDLDKLGLDDGKTYQLMARGDTLGTFQLDSSGMRQLLRMMKPDKFEDISAAGALYRPGPMGADSHTNYALRKNGKQAITAIHPELKEPLAEILDETYGLIVYQEQVMAIAQKVAGYSLAQADLLRRAMGKKKKAELDKQFEKFEAGMKANGFSANAVRTLWDLLIPFSDYAFNKAHSAAYGLLAYWTAYLKANYPSDYMAAVLTSVGDNKDKMAIYLAECRHMGLRVLPPDVNASGLHFTATSDDEIRFGLGAVRNVGTGAVESIREGRVGKPYVSFGDFLTRCGTAACTKRGVEALIKSGAFDSLGHPRQGMWQVHIPAVENAAKLGKKTAMGFESLFEDEDLDAVTVPDVEWDRKLKLAYEREMLGLYVSDHPLNGCEELLESARTVSIAELLEDGRDEQKVTISGMATSVKHQVSKKGSLWGLVVLEDLTSTVEVVLFGEAYQLAKNSLEEDVIYSVEGKLQIGDGRTSVITDRITRLESVDSERPVELFLTEADLTPEIVQELRFALKEHAGEKPVRVYLRRKGKTVLLALPDYPVEPSVAFFSDIKSLLGREALQKNDDEKRTA